MAEKSKYCEKAISIHTISFLERFEALQQQPKVNKDDVIVLKDRSGHYKKAYGVKLTFKVESVHACGLVIARKILPNGKFGPSEIVNDGPWMVEVDNTYIENIIMNNEDKYDPSVAVTELEKEKRRVTKHNRSISIKTSDEKEIAELLRSLKIGDKLWVNDYLISLKDERKEVTGELFIHKESYSWMNKPITELRVPVIAYYKYETYEGSYSSYLTISSLVGKFISKEEPESVRKT